MHLCQPQRRQRHAGHFRIVGILHDGDTAAADDRAQPAGAVVERAREDDADDAGPARSGRGAEEGIDGGTESVLARTTDDAESPHADEHVPVGVGRRHDAAAQEVDAVRGGVRPAARCAAPGPAPARAGGSDRGCGGRCTIAPRTARRGSTLPSRGMVQPQRAWPGASCLTRSTSDEPRSRVAHVALRWSRVRRTAVSADAAGENRRASSRPT